MDRQAGSMPGEPQGSLGAEVVTRELTGEELAVSDQRRRERGLPPLPRPEDITPERRASLEEERAKAKAWRAAHDARASS